jgi:hypothetical protein
MGVFYCVQQDILKVFVHEYKLEFSDFRGSLVRGTNNIRLILHHRDKSRYHQHYYSETSSIIDVQSTPELIEAHPHNSSSFPLPVY